ATSSQIIARNNNGIDAASEIVPVAATAATGGQVRCYSFGCCIGLILAFGQLRTTQLRVCSCADPHLNYQHVITYNEINVQM
ncbi:uncharacterized protein Dsimw501_GD27543, partial [Drosophila simulans]